MNDETIFATALEKATPSERSAYLDEACAGDAALRQRVEALLKAHGAAGNFLDRPAVEQIAAGVSQPKESTEVIDSSPQADEAIAESPSRASPGKTQAERPNGGGDGPSLDFLTPSQKPGSLGRLGHYEVLEVVGQGGMGVVLRAFDEVLHRVVAIKVMAPHLATNATARKRFIREAQAAAAVRDEHVVDIHAVEEANGLPYLVMEYVNGLSLQERLDRSGPLELKEVLRIGMQAAAGLAKAHAQGLIHRDIKPANILLENGVQRVKITDFGLARAVDDASLTQSGVVAGTPQYMAPEQARGEPVDHRSDLFSLGSVLYAMCAGHPPFRAGTTLAVLKRVSEDVPRPVREINPDVPAWLAAIIERLHAKDPAGRFQSAAEVAELLGQHLAHLQQPASVPAAAAPARDGALATGGRRRIRHWALAAALLLLLGGGLGLTEATGVTRVGEYVATVLRIRTPEGTLVVEVNDPQVKVTIDGDGEEIAITGAGPQEVRLRPGRYQVRASKDGVPVPLDTDLVTITRGGKQVVKVSREGAGRAEAGPPIKPPTSLGGVGLLSRVAFAPGGKLLASVHEDGQVILWDVATARVGMALEGHKLPARAVAFAPDGKQLATAAGDWRQMNVNGEVKLWDPATGKLLFTLPSSTGALFSVAFAPDGKTLAAAGRGGTVHLWDAATGKEQAPLTSLEGTGYDLAYAPDGKTLAVSLINAVQLWDVVTREKKGLLEGHLDEVECVRFSPDGKTIATGSRDHTVKLWDAATLQERATLKGHSVRVRSVAFSPDGKTLVSACRNSFVKLWDVTSGKELTGIPEPGLPGGSTVAFTPDGKTLASGAGDGTIRLWDVTAISREPVPVVGETRRFEGHTGPVRSVAFSPDGRYAISGSGWPQGDKTMRLWEVATGREVRRFAGHTDQVHAVAFSPDGRRALSGSFDGTMRLWDVETGQELRRFQHTEGLMSVAYSPDGRWALSTTDSPDIRLWDVSSGKLLRPLKGHTDRVQYATFSPDSRRVLSASHDGTMRLWDAENGQELRRFQGGTKPLECVAFSPDGRRAVSSGQEGVVRLWDLETGAGVRRFDGHTWNVSGVAFSPDGRRVASGGHDRMVRLWDAETGQELCRFVGHADVVWSVAFSPDGRQLLSGGGGAFIGHGNQEAGSDWALRLWTVPGAGPPAARDDGRQATLKAHADIVWCVAVAPDGEMLATASADKTVKLWKRHGDSWQHEKTLRGHQAAVRCVAFSPGGKALATGSFDATLKLWDPASGQERQTLRGHAETINALAFAPDGATLASASLDRTVKLWDVKTGQEQATLRGHADWVLGVAFSADGKTLASADRPSDKPGPGVIKLWDVASKKELATLRGHQGWVEAVAFAPDRDLLASAGHDGTVRLWDAATAVHHATLAGHQEPVVCVTFAPGGNLLASAGYDKTVRLWDLTTGKARGGLQGHQWPIRSAAFTPDGRTLATADQGGVVRLWDVSRWAAPPRTQAPAAAPFVILPRGGKAEQKFATLAEAVAAAESGDTIEVRGNGPFASPPVFIAKPLTIWAGKGFGPVIELSPAQVQGNIPLLETSAPLVLEGLELRRIGKKYHESGPLPKVMSADRAPLRATNCRFVAFPDCVAAFADWSPLCEVRNCEFLSYGQFARVDHRLPHGGRLILGNNVMLGGDFGVAFHHAQADLADVAIELTGNTLVVQTPLGLFLDTPPAPPAPGADAPAKPIRLKASANLLDGQVQVMEVRQGQGFLSRAGPLEARDAQALLGRLVAWSEQDNVYPEAVGLLGLYVKCPQPLPAGGSVADWNRFWGVRGSAAVRGKIRYRGGDLLSRALTQLQPVTAEDFRLQADSPGKGSGEGGRDLGADVDLVGPGAAYERWKKTPAYRLWVKDTGQVQEGN
jgi:WD40 repeat protein